MPDYGAKPGVPRSSREHWSMDQEGITVAQINIDVRVSIRIADYAVYPRCFEVVVWLPGALDGRTASLPMTQREARELAGHMRAMLPGIGRHIASAAVRALCRPDVENQAVVVTDGVDETERP